MQQDFINDAESLGLEVKTTTEGQNGYPSNLKKFITGFDNFTQAQEFASNRGLEVCQFRKRDGHEFWQNRGCQFEPLDIHDKVSDLGDDYEILDYDTELEALKERINDSESFEQIQEFTSKFETIQNEFEILEENESIILNCGEYYETCKNKMLSYSEDVYTYCIGVQ